MTRDEFIEGNLPPVSYTHLDVYKRQALTDADDDLLAAVRAAEEAAAIKPNNVSDIDMDEQPESSGFEEDDLMKALREAEAAFGGTSFHDAADEAPEEDTSAAADPWAELQNQLKAMESANGASSAITYDAPEPQEEEQREEQSTTCLLYTSGCKIVVN